MIEDDLAIGQALLSVFQDEGHTAVWLRLAADAGTRIRDEAFDAVVLDLGLPDGDGNDLLRMLRADGVRLPVLIISARDSLQDRLKGFDLGADDYLIKPFEIPELLVRLRAIVRRAHGTLEENLWTAGDIVLDENRMAVTRGGQPVTLSKTEFALLLTLMKQANRVLTRVELERRALPAADGQSGQSQTLDVHIFNLRKKIGEGVIRTVRGVGYMVQQDA
ncbi:response regulator transcription factor [Telluria beijingensis]|uniref:response regulator transcription factor n=1 Tax=Telluria beijingensis TaxID=3068633 RepID=UPI002795BD81|nr:response regulator transcription factor [Massilia sp. REN29]